MRNLFHYLLIPFWDIRVLLLKAFWRLRAIGFKSYWKTRSLPHRARRLGRDIFYKYLYKYSIFKIARSYIRSAGNQFFKIKIKILHGLKGREYSLVPISSFIELNGIRSIIVEPRSIFFIKGPQFIGDYDFKPVGDAFVNLDMPKLEVVSLNNASVIGGTNFVFVNSNAVYPDDYIPERDVCPAELNGIAKINIASKTISIYSDEGRAIDKAVSLLGSCTGNYAHWLTETLPKLLIIDSVEGFNDFPLLVDSWIHPNFVASIALLNKNKREIIRIGRWNSVLIKSLVEVSPTAYVPPEYRYFIETNNLNRPRSEDFTFSRTALNMLRDGAHNAVGPIPKVRQKKFYLYRSRESCGNTRHVTNIKDVERMVRNYGYVMLDPAKLSFKEQILAFSTAKKIISPLGAALANTIFTRPGCTILGLSPYYENANYYYFSNFMGALGHEMYYVLGPQKERGGHPIHKDYEIDMTAFARALNFLESN